MPPSADAPNTHIAWRRFLFAAAIVLVAGLLLLPWWRNHAILNDFYDYGLVMAGAGRIELGERPYVDFLTPIQTLHFRLAVLAESAFGPHYLSLTYANAVFMAGGFLGMVALLFRPLGAATATIVAAAIVAASSGQHTIVWHNALGVAWVAGVVWLSARLKFSRSSWWQVGLICILLYLGGMTKLTYQVTALAFAGLFALRDSWLGESSWSKALIKLGCYLFSGVIAPVAAELQYTGANFQQWYYNVVQLPDSRIEMLKALSSFTFFVRPEHNAYHPMLMPWVGAWATGLIILITWLTLKAMRAANRTGNARKHSILLLALTAMGAWLCGAVLFTTNIEIAYLAGAVWLVLTTGIALAWPGNTNGVADRSTRIALCAAGLILLSTSWISAWRGTRALWSPAPFARETLVSTQGLPKRYDYFRGMQIPRPMWLSMESFDHYLSGLGHLQIAPDQIFFANATEWMVRAVPEARHRGLPLWMHLGTSFGELESRVLNHRLAMQREIRAVVSLDAWNYWHYQTGSYLDRYYQHDRIGPLFHFYTGQKENDLDPLRFAIETHSTAFEHDLVTARDDADLRLYSNLSKNFLGAEKSFLFKTRRPAHRIRGRWIMHRIAAISPYPTQITWRAFAINSDGSRVLLQEQSLKPALRESALTATFELEPGDKPVAFEVELPPDKSTVAGFRELEFNPSPDQVAPEPPTIDTTSPRRTPSPEWARALFVQPVWQKTTLTGASIVLSADMMPTGPELMAHTPSELWFRIDDPKLRQIRGEFGIRSTSWTDPDALEGVVARVVFYRAGRLDILFSQKLRPKMIASDRSPNTFQAMLPGEPGWVGFIFTSLNPPTNADGQTWWRRVELH